MAETLSLISVVSFIASGIFAILTITLWFLFRIPAVAGDLSGRTAKKEIERMRRENEGTGKKKRGTGDMGRRREKNILTIKKIEKSGETPEIAETGLLHENRAGVLQNEETGLLEEADATASAESPEEGGEQNHRIPAIRIALLEEILMVHTEEVIQ